MLVFSGFGEVTSTKRLTDMQVMMSPAKKLSGADKKRKSALIILALNQPKKKSTFSRIASVISPKASIKRVERAITSPFKVAGQVKRGHLKGADKRRAIYDFVNPAVTVAKIAGVKNTSRSMDYLRMADVLTWKGAENRRIKKHGMTGTAVAAVVAATVLTAGGASAGAAGGGSAGAGAGTAAGAGAGAAAGAAGAAGGGSGLLSTLGTWTGYLSTASGVAKTATSLIPKKKEDGNLEEGHFVEVSPVENGIEKQEELSFWDKIIIAMKEIGIAT